MTNAMLLDMRDITCSFGGLRAVDGVSFGVAERSITSLIGPNGAGKSTLFNIVTGYLHADRGVALLNGRVITGKPPHRIAQAGLTRTFQTPRAFTRLSVLENMLLAMPEHPGEELSGLLFRRRKAGRCEKEALERARELLGLVGLGRHEHAYAGTLSGGERKLLDLVRALMAEPRIVLLDEPMAGVNPRLRRLLVERLLAFRVERSTTFLVVEHDLDVVMSMSDRVVVMSEGKVIAAGAPEDVRRDERVIDAYLGTEQPKSCVTRV